MGFENFHLFSETLDLLFIFGNNGTGGLKKLVFFVDVINESVCNFNP